MGRRLNTTVLVGSTVYPAGTREEDIDGTITAEGVWDGTADDVDPSPSDESSERVKALETQLRELSAERDGLADQVEALTAERDDLAVEVGPLRTERDTLRGERDAVSGERDELRNVVASLTAERDRLAAASTPGGGTDRYANLDLDQLKAEIDRRNEGRADEAKILKRGGKDTLIGFLVADDETVGGF